MFSRVGVLFSRRLVVKMATQHRYGRPRFSGGFAFATAAATTLVGGATVASCYSFSAWNGSGAAPPFDLKALKEDIEALVSDDLSKGPLFLRLAWHEAGSWDCKKKDGSPNSASMRFRPECDYGANAGLDKARKALEPLKQKYPQISYADLWSLAGVVSVEAMGGPVVPWRWGRVDAKDGSACGPDGRLPDASKTQNHVREVFTRLGFNDDETVALIGAHTCGECHLEYSGFKGPWTHDRYGFDNSFFTELFNNEWEINPEVKNLQFMDRSTKSLMMLPSDMALLLDDKYRAIAKKYAADNDLFCASFAKAFQKLLELGTKNLKSVPGEERV